MITFRKILTTICRILVGVLFIISGLIKANDPTGFAYKLNEYWQVFHMTFLTPTSVFLAMMICVVEIFLGINLLLGAFKRFTMALLILMIVFFTFLTFYSAYFHKVTDCGCFGDALHLTPWTSFGKDIALLILIMELWFNRAFISSILPRNLRYGISIGGLILSMIFTSYCYYYLPVKDFLPYAKGKDIEKQMALPAGARSDSFVMTFIYEKGGKEYNFTMDELGKVKDLDTYKFKDRKDVLIRKGDEPAIHDFVIYAMDKHELTQDFLHQKGYRLVIIQQELENSNLNSQKKVNELVKSLGNLPIHTWGLTASSQAIIKDYKAAYDVPYDFFNSDGTMLKTMIRSNPGLILLKDNLIIKKWPGTSCPTASKMHDEMTFGDDTLK